MVVEVVITIVIVVVIASSHSCIVNRFAEHSLGLNFLIILTQLNYHEWLNARTLVEG